MKIAQVVSTFPPYRGGMGNVAYSITDHLSRLSYDVTVFTPKRSFRDQDIKSYFRIFNCKPLIRLGNAAILPQLSFRLFTYDIVHFHYPFIGSLLSTVLPKLIRGEKQKLIVHYHMDLVGQGWKKLFFWTYNKLFLGLAIRLADKIMVTTIDYAKESILAPYLKKNPDKFIEVPNGVDVDFFKPRSKVMSLVRKYNLENKKSVLFVGALDSAHYFKGVNYLIKAFELLNRKDVKLLIVGEGDLKKVYMDLVESFNLNDQVIFIGYVPDDQLVDYYNLADIFVLPSIDKSEAFGMVLIEAMACAKPVIATDLAGVREVVDVRINGRLVKPKNVEALTRQMEYFLESERRRINYGKKGRLKVVEEYSWYKIVQKIIICYNEKTL